MLLSGTRIKSTNRSNSEKGKKQHMDRERKKMLAYLLVISVPTIRNNFSDSVG